MPVYLVVCEASDEVKSLITNVVSAKQWDHLEIFEYTLAVDVNLTLQEIEAEFNNVVRGGYMILPLSRPYSCRTPRNIQSWLSSRVVRQK